MRMVGVHKTGLPPLEKLSLGLGMLRALSTCFRTSRSVFICWLHHHEKLEKYWDSGLPPLEESYH